nr:MAG TPA: hypothetical protein [Caudoviricetes sp.]
MHRRRLIFLLPLFKRLFYYSAAMHRRERMKRSTSLWHSQERPSRQWG